MSIAILRSAMLRSAMLRSVSAGILLAVGAVSAEQIPASPVLYLPLLEEAPDIDGDLADWRDQAFSDGVWDIQRLRHTPWFQAWRNRLTDHGTDAAPEPHPDQDLAARYYAAWDATYFYVGADVQDNVNDVDDPEHQPRRWYFKDSICWFIEAPADEAPERFGRGDNAFCFVIDASKPDYGAWWRHGTVDSTYVEEPLPAGSVDYALRVDPDGDGVGDFILEARVDMASTFGVSDPAWRPPSVGDVYSMEIVHCDPDGGPYGGHFLVYGTGDEDETWSRAILSPPSGSVMRESE